MRSEQTHKSPFPKGEARSEGGCRFLLDAVKTRSKENASVGTTIGRPHGRGSLPYLSFSDT